MKSPCAIQVSRHAIERYVERIGGEELDALADIRQMIERSQFFGKAGSVKRGPISLVISEGIVVTVLTADKRPKRKTRKRMFEDCEAA